MLRAKVTNVAFILSPEATAGGSPAAVFAELSVLDIPAPAEGLADWEEDGGVVFALGEATELFVPHDEYPPSGIVGLGIEEDARK